MVNVPARYILPMIAFRDALCITHNPVNGTQLQSLIVVAPVSDADLKHLEGLTSLTSVYLSNTQVTDAGLMHLKALTKLDKLAVFSAKVTDAGANELMRALPMLKIQRECVYHAAAHRP